MVDKWKDYTKENPAAAFCIAAMDSALAFASGGIVRMAIGFFIKLANNIVIGDKLSSAVAKTGKQMAIGVLLVELRLSPDVAADLFPRSC